MPVGAAVARDGRGSRTRPTHANFGRQPDGRDRDGARHHVRPARPTKCTKQIKKFYDHVGGFGHLLLMGQAGFLDHDETVRGIQTFAREVYPRLKEGFGPASADVELERLASPTVSR